MTRILVVLLAAFLLLAPAAMAKGPNVIMTTGEAAEPGKPWEATLEFNEFRRVQPPVMTGVQGERRVTAKVTPVPASIDGATGYKARLVFPSAGRWRILVVSGKRSFKFQTIKVGSGEVPQDYVAFPEGSMAAKQGAGGVYLKEEGPDGSGEGTALEPEVITYADAQGNDDDDGGGGPEPWLFPLVGVVLAGAGVATLRRRR